MITTFDDLLNGPPPALNARIILKQGTYGPIAIAAHPEDEFEALPAREVSDRTPGAGGYTKRGDSGLCVYVAGSWRRVWIVQISNAGSAYVELTQAEVEHYGVKRAFVKTKITK